MKKTTQQILTEFFNSNIETMSRTESDWKFRAEFYSILINLGFKEVRESLDQKHQVTYLFHNNVMLFDLKVIVNVFSQTITLVKEFKTSLLSFEQVKLLNALKKDILTDINDSKVSALEKETLGAILHRLKQII